MNTRARRQRLQTMNRLVWIVLFLLVSALFAWAEWREGGAPGIGWFLAASLWSAVCGIGFSACDWWLRGGFGSRQEAGEQSKMPPPADRE